MFAALLDTNVLWPGLRRDFLLSLAIEGLYRPLWSEVILEELEYEEAEKLRKRGEDGPERRAAHLTRQLRTHFEDAIVRGWEQLSPFGLPDPDDEHVLAAAVVGGAGALVTENVKDFPRARVPAHIEILRAADFARDAVSVDPQRAAQAMEAMASRRSGQTPQVLADLLQQRYAMHEAVAMLRDILGGTA